MIILIARTSIPLEYQAIPVVRLAERSVITGFTSNAPKASEHDMLRPLLSKPRIENYQVMVTIAS
jgi:hypothetical protein